MHLFKKVQSKITEISQDFAAILRRTLPKIDTFHFLQKVKEENLCRRQGLGRRALRRRQLGDGLLRDGDLLADLTWARSFQSYITLFYI